MLTSPLLAYRVSGRTVATLTRRCAPGAGTPHRRMITVAMAKTVELRRHTASDGDLLTPDGVAAAVAIGERLNGAYDLVVSSGAQRATQTLACFLAGLGRPQPSGVTVDGGFR